MGPAWHRYNHDGYGQQEDGGPFTEFGTGRVWPLLTGERGHYELAAGRKTEKYLRTMEALASKTGLLPEQSWDEADKPEVFMFFGKPTGSAMPLMWAHAEYIKFLRSTADGKVYDACPKLQQGTRASALIGSSLPSGSRTGRLAACALVKPSGFRLTSHFECTGRSIIGSRYRTRTQ